MADHWHNDVLSAAVPGGARWGGGSTDLSASPQQQTLHTPHGLEGRPHHPHPSLPPGKDHPRRPQPPEEHQVSYVVSLGGCLLRCWSTLGRTPGMKTLTLSVLGSLLLRVIYLWLYLYFCISLTCIWKLHIKASLNWLHNDSKKGKFLYSAVSSPQDHSERFTLYFPDRPVHPDTISASLGSIQPYTTIIMQRLLIHISTTVCSQVLIYTAEWTGAM